MRLTAKHPIQEPLFDVLTRSMNGRLKPDDTLGLATAVCFIGRVVDEIGIERTDMLLRESFAQVSEEIATVMSSIMNEVYRADRPKETH